MTSNDIRTRLIRGDVLVADGATGTMLQAAGLQAGLAPEHWVLERPEAIIALHRAYAEAGSDYVMTSTFGGNRYRLATRGLADRLVEINRRAVELARQGVAGRALVLASMGPTGELMAPMGLLSHREVADAFAEQAAALMEAGVDGFVIETMADLNEARAAIEGVRRVSDGPLFCSFSFDTHGRTMMGLRPGEAAAAIWSLGVDAVGGNCGADLDDMVAAVAAMREAVPEAVILAKPNAGLPRMVGDRVIYDVTPERMASYARRFVELGAQIVGGCCGSTPAHIAAIVSAVRG